MAEASVVSGPDFEHMTKDEIIAWFETTEDISPLLATMTPATEAVQRQSTDGPMMLVSIRLPVAVVERLDSVADLQGVRRSRACAGGVAPGRGGSHGGTPRGGVTWWGWQTR
jgi:hypothetical protein